MSNNTTITIPNVSGMQMLAYFVLRKAPGNAEIGLPTDILEFYNENIATWLRQEWRANTVKEPLKTGEVFAHLAHVVPGVASSLEDAPPCLLVVYLPNEIANSPWSKSIPGFPNFLGASTPQDLPAPRSIILLPNVTLPGPVVVGLGGQFNQEPTHPTA